MRRAALIAILAVVVQAAPSGAAPKTAPSPPAASVNEDALKAPFDALPEADRRALQDALLWTGDFAGVVTGAFGPRTRDALAAFARRSGMASNTVLDPNGRAKLLAAAAALRAAVGFGPVKDKTAGVTVSLPMKLLPRRVSGEGGTHYASADGNLAVDTLSRPAGPGGLADVFDRMSTASGARRVTYKLLKPDFFVVSGEIAERKFYSRFVIGTLDGQALIRGLTFAYPKSDAATFDPVALAAAGSFEAFPQADGTSPPAPPSVQAAPPPTFALTAIRIDAGVALTRLPAQSCVKPTLEGMPVALRGSDVGTGLALFDIPPVSSAPPISTVEAVPSGAALLALYRRGAQGIDVAPAEVVSSADPTPDAFLVSAGLQGRAEGAAIVDRQGRLAGMAMEPKRLAPSLQGTRVQNDYPILSSVRLKAFLRNAGIAGDAPEAPSQPTVAAVLAAWKPRLLRIVCQTAGASP